MTLTHSIHVVSSTLVSPHKCLVFSIVDNSFFYPSDAVLQCYYYFFYNEKKVGH